MAVDSLSPEEIAAFLADNAVGAHDSIITRMPLEFSLCVRWNKLQELLERIAGVKFNTNPPSKYGRAMIVLPLREIVKELKPSRSSSYDGRMTIVPICRTASKGNGFPDRDGKLWMPHGLFERQVHRMGISGSGKQVLEHLDRDYLYVGLPEQVRQMIELEKRVSVAIEGQKEGIPAYTYRTENGWQEFQYFSSIEAIRHLPRYPCKQSALA